MKLVLREQDSTEAHAAVGKFLKRSFSLCTVDIALAESLNAVWKHVNIHKDLRLHDGESAVRDLLKLHNNLEVLRTGELAEDAVNVAHSEKVTVYDALYIAATRKLNATLLTSDKKLCGAAEAHTKANLLKT